MKVQASKLKVPVMWKEILSRNATLSVLLLVQRTILYVGENTDFDDSKSKVIRRIRLVIS